ncbi:sensor domain-containing diguanylate cyclase, partial [bacterium]
TAPRERRFALIAAGALGNLLSSALIGDGLATGLPVALCNAFEVWIASVWQRRIAASQDLTDRLTFHRFIAFAVVLAPLASTALVAVWGLIAAGRVDPGLQGEWLISHALGMATFTPVTMALRRDDVRRLMQPPQLGEFLLALALVAVVTVAVFAQSRYPLLFLVFPAMLWLAMRTGFAGTAIAVVLVVVLAVGFTVAGFGPLTLATGFPRGQHFLVLQVFISSLLLTMFPIVVVLAERRRAHQAESDLALRSRLLAEHSTDVIVLTDTASRRLYVSPAVTEMFGYTPEDFQRMTWHEFVHPDDRERIARELRDRAETGSRATVTYRARRADGSDIWVEALVCTFVDDDFARVVTALGLDGVVDGGADGREGRVVTLRDVSRRRRAEEALAQANTELASLVWKDALTGLGNRRRFDEAMAEEWDRCSRAGQPLSLIMVDVDHFKAFNDEHGHQHGDHRLIGVAAAISGALFRPRDVAVRYGGEEFAVILPATGVDEAGLVAERIRENVVSLDGSQRENLGTLTVSTGVAGAVPTERGRPEDLMKAADDALYTSKREGRNRTTLLQVNWPPDGASRVRPDAAGRAARSG